MSYYLPDILSSARRVLTLQDRNPLGATEGLFSRNFWHFRTADFPSATDQMSVAILAKLWNLEGTIYYKNPELFNWIIQGIRGLERIQKNDGSFDEWYFNERGWAGPTGYVMNAALDTYSLVQDQLPAGEKNRLEHVIRKGVSFLTKSQEGHMLANHLAIVILPLMQARSLLKMSELTSVIDDLVGRIESVWNEDEGWSTEYDGADPGYQSGTLSFLMKALQYAEDPRLYNICLRSLEFISHFAFPSGAVGGAVGSRHTVTFFCAGIEALRHTELGARLSAFLEEGFNRGTQILSSDLDDHYLIYRLYELLDAHFFTLNRARSSSLADLPWEQKDLRKSFPKAGIEVGKYHELYWVTSLSRGGAIRIENTNTRKILLVDNGVISSAKEKLFTSLWQGRYEIQVAASELLVRGKLVDVSPKIFSPLKLIIFRIVSILTGLHHRPSLWLKDLIRKLMMVNNKTSSHVFERKISFNNGSISIETTLTPGRKLDKVFIGGEFWSRYVPQSRHFTVHQLESFHSYCEKQSLTSPLTHTQHIGA